MRSIATVWCLLLALALAPSSAVAESWYESYQRAEEAIAKEEWSEAVRQLNAALALRPNSGINVRTYGMRFVDYFPYLELGIAYYHLDQIDAAAQAFETELRQGAIASSESGRLRLQESLERVERARLERAEGRASRAPEIVVSALAAARELEMEGRFEDALAALARAVAVAPDEREVVDARQRLLAAAAAEEQQRAERERFAKAQAAVALEPALGSEDSDARLLRERILRAQAASEESGERAAAIGQLLIEAERLLAEGEFERALRAANRVLVLEPTHDAALRQISRAYARLSDALLAPDRTAPVVLLDKLPHAGVNGRPTVVRSPELVLLGTVYDATSVEIEIFVGGRPLGKSTVESRELQGVWITDFRAEQLLAAGLSTIEIVAVDAAGNRGVAEVRIEFVVPFVRSWRFPLALAGGLGVAGAGWRLARARRRRRLLDDRFNPYVAGAPILEQARFFGRDQLLEYVLRRVSNNSIMLHGERRIGKTSFQHRLKRCLAALDDPVYEFHPVFIDLQGTRQEKFFATLAAELFHELAPKLGGIEPSAPPSGDAYGYSELVKDIQRVLKALRERTTKKIKLVFLIDEVDELNDYDPRINQRLRSLFMRAFADSLVSVVSGVAIKKEWEREGSPWYNFFQEIEVKPLDPDEARLLIEAPVKGVFEFDAGVSDEIIRRTESKPYLIQRLCSALVDRLHEERRRRISAADVEAACRVEGL